MKQQQILIDNLNEAIKAILYPTKNVRINGDDGRLVMMHTRVDTSAAPIESSRKFLARWITWNKMQGNINTAVYHALNDTVNSYLPRKRSAANMNSRCRALSSEQLSKISRVGQTPKPKVASTLAQELMIDNINEMQLMMQGLRDLYNEIDSALYQVDMEGKWKLDKNGDRMYIPTADRVAIINAKSSKEKAFIGKVGWTNWHLANPESKHFMGMMRCPVTGVMDAKSILLGYTRKLSTEQFRHGSYDGATDAPSTKGDGSKLDASNFVLIKPSFGGVDNDAKKIGNPDKQIAANYKQGVKHATKPVDLLSANTDTMNTTDAIRKEERNEEREAHKVAKADREHQARIEKAMFRKNVPAPKSADGSKLIRPTLANPRREASVKMFTKA